MEVKFQLNKIHILAVKVLNNTAIHYTWIPTKQPWQ